MTPRYEAPARSISGTDADLLDQLRYADGRPYGFYKNALGAWDYGDFTLAIDHVQADPYAPPSSLRAWTRPEAMGLPEAALASPDARLAAGDFIARAFDEAMLARRSGVSEAPLAGDGVVAFTAPESLRATVTLPHAGEVSGMAIPPGLTLIVGGGYHGKSTLLEAIAQGVYAHVPGDGRELVATDPTATKVRAADGRAVTGVDISPFITHLPGGADTTSFSTENASGSTSQAASIIESLELGARTLLIDEDTSATNLLIRDTRMRDLVAADKEPITPLVDRVTSLTEAGISLIMVVGGSGAFLDAADRVLMMDNYHCLDVTSRARTVVANLPRPRTDAPTSWEAAPRVPAAKARVDRPRTKASGTSVLTIDRSTIDISDVAAVVDPGQAEAIAWCVRGVLEEMAGKQSMPDLMAKLGRRLASEGLDAVCKFGARPYPAFLARPRLIDVGAAINRYRGLSLREPRGEVVAGES